MTDVAAKNEIAELHYKYARGLDEQDWATFASIFDDEVEGDFSRWGMGQKTTMGRDDFTALVRFLFSTKNLVTQHYMTNFLINVDGDNASGDVYVFARHKIGSEIMDLNAFYRSTYRLTDAGWKIASIALHPRWDQGGDVIKFFQIPDPQPSGRAHLFVTATPILEQHDALERYVGGIVPMLMQAGGSAPMIIKEDETLVGTSGTFMSMIVTFPTSEAAAAARAVFDSPEYNALVPDRDLAFSKMNISFYSDMPQASTGG
ncbi:MAG: nuclear transport factor 2 family protein [Pseudomonadota bacterium]